MTVNRTTLLDLPLPVSGTESGTWGDTTNNGLTQYMDIAIAGMSNLTSANFTAGALTIETTEGDSSATNISATSAQYAGFRVTSLATNSTITVGNTGTSPARSYRLINADATYSLTFKATGQTGVTLLPGQSALVAFNGTDYVIVGVVGAGSTTDNTVPRFDGTTGEILQSSGITIDDSNNVSGVGQLNATTLDITNIEVTNIKAKDGTAAASIADSTGKITVSTELAVDNLNLSGNTLSSTDTNGNIVLTPNGDGSVVITNNGTSNALRITQTGTGNALLVEDSANPDATPFVVDASGVVGIGTTTPQATFSLTAGIGIQSTGAFTPQIVQRNKTNDSSASYYIAQKDRAGAIVQSGDAIGNIVFQAFDGASMLDAVRIVASVDGTPGTNDMPGRLVFQTTADGASSPTERMRIDSAGNVGIGGAATAGNTLVSYKAMTGGGGYVYAFNNVATVNSDATVEAVSFQSYLSTQAASFTVANLRHFKAYQSTIGAGSTVTNQAGYFADASLTGATNNYGFYSNIASGTGRWNFYANGTASNFFGGNTIISVADNTNAALRITQTGTADALLVEDSANPDATPFVINSGGQTTVGHTSQPWFITGVVPLFGVVGIDNLTATSSIARYSNDSGQAWLMFGKSRGTSIGTNTIVQNGDNIGSIDFSAADGTSNIPAARITASVDGTPGTNDMPGRLTFSTTADGASSPTERMRIDSAGGVGIGATSLTGYNLRLGKNITGATIAYGQRIDAQTNSDVTSFSSGYSTRLYTQAASFTLNELTHYQAFSTIFGAGSTVTNQYGFNVTSALTGATNNYGFFSNIASGTGRWNFYANGTAANYFAGSTGIGGVPGSDDALRVAQNSTLRRLTIDISSDTATVGPSIKFYRTRTTGTNVSNNDLLGEVIFQGVHTSTFPFAADIQGYVDGTPGANDLPGRLVFRTTADGASSPTERMRIDNAGNVGIGGAAAAYTRLQVTGTLPSSSNASYGISSSGTVPATSTSSYISFDSAPSTAVGSFTLTSLNHFFAYQGTIGAGSTVTNQYGFNVSSTLTGATNNYGFFSNIASGTGRYNFYANGTAENYFGGKVTVSTRIDYKVAGVASEYSNGNAGASKTITWSNGAAQSVTLDQNTTLTFSFTDCPVGNYLLKITQDATGGRTITWSTSTPSTTRWLGVSGAPTLNSAASSVSFASFYWDGSNSYGSLGRVNAV